MDQATQYRPDRHPSESYEDILARDTRPVPDCLRQGPTRDLGEDGIPVTNYFDPDHFAREVRHVWLKVWQWGCREEDIPEAGDVFLYDIVGKSVIVARQADGSIKAFYNSCLHRGRKLVDTAGNKPHFWCKYHGMSWTCAGRMRANPIAWDFPQFERRDTSLPELKVGCWGGFVFVNFDPAAAPLEETLGPLVEHFAAYDLAGRYRAAHVSKIVPCNWKVMAEAFMESHHTGATHPQIAAFLADVNSQYDIVSDHVSRQFTAIAVPSPTLSARRLSEMAILQAMGAVSSASADDADAEHLPTGARDTPKAPTMLHDGQTARMYAAEAMRQALGAEDGFDYAGISDAEMLDALLYNVFPHQSFWAGHAPTLIYRWRPNGLDPETSVMDVVILKRVPEGAARPKPAAEFALGLDQDWTAATPYLGAGLAAVFEQDMENMPAVQAGLRSSGTGVVHFGLYSEMRIRHMHQMIARMIADGEEKAKNVLF
jgi:phenylpropionate dioxygenase-like ring-hydroxylating dioxygenase large terminal subunit